MKRFLLIPLLLLPLAAGAAADPVSSSTATKSTYLAESRIMISQPLGGDLVAAGGTVDVRAPVAGDVLAAGGTVLVSQGAGGDVRVAGGKVSVTGLVAGDIAAAGGTVRVRGAGRSIYAAGGSVDVEGSSAGDVTIYGANVFLSGDYQGDVSVVASNKLTLGENTHIHGQLRYSAPEELTVPDTVHIDGGARYTGAYAYVPTNKQVHQYALIGTILFFLVRVLAGAIVAGLIAGLFPAFVERICSLVLTRDTQRSGKMFIIGLLVAIGIPLLSLFLLVSFVGAELAVLLIVGYIFLALIGYASTGILAGAILRKTVLDRLQGPRELGWSDAVLGTVLVHLVGLVPLLGTPVIFLVTLAVVGAISYTAYRAAFSNV